MNEQHALSFLEFIDGRHLRPTYVDLQANLREFASSGEINSEIAKQIRTSLASTRKFLLLFCSKRKSCVIWVA